MLDAKIPSGHLREKWTNHKSSINQVNPEIKRKYEIIVVGTGLAGSAAASSLAEQGYKVKVFCMQDSPRRAHSIAAQGGINAAKHGGENKDNIESLFRDMIIGGDFRSREANVYRLAEVSNSIIDQCVAQGVPFTREYDGSLASYSFGHTNVARTFYAYGQTGQQLLLGAYGTLMKEVANNSVMLFTRRELVDIVLVEGVAIGVVVRNLITGDLESHSADAVVLATGGYANVYNLSTNARSSNASAIWRAYKKGAFFANPCFIQIHPTCIPPRGNNQSKLTIMSESLRNAGRVWVPKNPKDTRNPQNIPNKDRDYFLEEEFPNYGNLAPRDMAARSISRKCEEGRGVSENGNAVYMDFRKTIKKNGTKELVHRYKNIFHTYQRITGDNPLETPMMIYPAPHYSMGGLWVDYNLMSNIPGLFVIGEANYSDHGANRLGASGLLQTLADGYFIVPHTINSYLSNNDPHESDLSHLTAFRESETNIKQKIHRLLTVKGKCLVDDYAKRLGSLLWKHCGIIRKHEGLNELLIKIPEIRDEFWDNVNVPGSGNDINQTLERALRLADYLEFAELIAKDALYRQESCGAHFRAESSGPNGEPKRNDEQFSYVAAWQFNGIDKEPVLYKELLSFEYTKCEERQ